MILITGSAGHLGEALVRVLRGEDRAVVGIDLLPSACTDFVGSITDRELVARAMTGVTAVIHTATLHKPHVATHSKQAFVDTNISGTLTLLEEAARQNAKSFVFTSSTSAFGDALSPPPGEPAAWISEAVPSIPKNIYGVTKVAAEDMCQLFQRRHGLPVVVLRTSRFFPEADDAKDRRDAYEDANLKVNELLHRRADLEDIVSAHLKATERAPALGFARYIISATSPFTREDLRDLALDAPAVVARHVPAYVAEYTRRNWKMFARVDRVYDNTSARESLGWTPKHSFESVLARLERNEDFRSDLTLSIVPKGYHSESFADGPYPVD